ncbi:hypothetical protein ATZ33_13025 [Enterococcus silesiacus]|uniref:Uncharacterized protein n=1 Tax=Enterococcus silesiacus TaxID=332949 RepID=A0A0S3KDG3_9ENTE|nr:hypothetical protein [Enterococcus silesiacus]ALS02274.1 hypothetical protein ATZ33_13025 [Enterococcus silesiacus]OJG92367.1 hypothetical protein RV15_GL003160 [Enterococcus silesiacus]
MNLLGMDLTVGGESYSDVISSLQQKITFESNLKEPNSATVTLYKIQLEQYQKLEKKRVQKIALQAKCVSVFNPLKEEAAQMQNIIKTEQFDLGSSVETFVQNAPDMVKGQAGNAFSHEVSVMRNSVIEASGMCEAVT